MYEITKSVITSGGYKLADIQRKVKKLHILGDLTEEQMDELLAMTQKNASADSERSEVLVMIQNLADRISALEERLEAQGDTEAEQPEHEDWKPWDGISNKYQPGAIVNHNGQLWKSVFSGQNVWEPGTVGTEMLWVIYDAIVKEV